MKHETLPKPTNRSELLAISIAVGSCAVALFQRNHYKRRIKSLEQKSNVDELTGLNNLKSFNESLTAIIESQKDDKDRRKLRQTSILGIIDLDRFKDVNDSKGHLAGDSVLVEAAATLKDTLRAGDEAFRLGGDEFAVIVHIPHDEDEAHVQEELSTRFEQQLNDLGEHIGVNSLGASTGFTTILPNDSLETVRHRADLNMYGNKQTQPR